MHLNCCMNWIDSNVFLSYFVDINCYVSDLLCFNLVAIANQWMLFTKTVGLFTQFISIRYCQFRRRELTWGVWRHAPRKIKIWMPETAVALRLSNSTFWKVLKLWNFTCWGHAQKRHFKDYLLMLILIFSKLCFLMPIWSVGSLRIKIEHKKLHNKFNGIYSSFEHLELVYMPHLPVSLKSLSITECDQK